MAFKEADALDEMPASDNEEEKIMITIDTNLEEEDQHPETDPNNKVVCPNRRDIIVAAMDYWIHYTNE